VTPAELRDIRNRVVSTTDEEVDTLLEALRTWMRRRAENGELNLRLKPASMATLFESTVQSEMGLLIRPSATYNTLSGALERLRAEGFKIEVWYQGASFDRMPDIGDASATDVWYDASLFVTVSW
jgi:hypothetical protein